MNNVKKIPRPNHIGEVMVFVHGVDHGAMRPSIPVGIVMELDKFIKNIWKLFGFVIDHDVPYCGIMVKGRE